MCLDCHNLKLELFVPQRGNEGELRLRHGKRREARLDRSDLESTCSAPDDLRKLSHVHIDIHNGGNLCRRFLSTHRQRAHECRGLAPWCQQWCRVFSFGDSWCEYESASERRDLVRGDGGGRRGCQARAAPTFGVRSNDHEAWLVHGSSGVRYGNSQFW